VPTVLLTTFEPYGPWPTNASRLALDELTRDTPAAPKFTARVLPVDFDRVKAQLAQELAANYDYVLHLGQAPGSAGVQLEAVGLNIACDHDSAGDRCLCDDGPLAYRSSLPLFDWAEQIRALNIPAEVSFHAGTFLCNAALYLTHYYIERMKLDTKAAFIHLPLDPSQSKDHTPSAPSLSAVLSGKAIRIVLESLELVDTAQRAGAR
jgi:pyroglutamyl-peptidase